MCIRDRSTDANSITMVVWDNEKSRELVKALNDAFYQVRAVPVAIVCAMGSNIAIPGFLYKAAKALYDRGINIESFAQSLRQVNMQFVISRDKYEDAVIALNDELCKKPNYKIG